MAEIYVTSAYDDGVFRKEFFEILPSIDPVLDMFPILRESVFKLISGKIASKAFLLTFKNIMVTFYGVSQQFFIDVEKIDSGESIYLGKLSPSDYDEKE